MKTLITFICAMLMVACGGNTTNNTTVPVPTPVVEETGPPWERLPATERAPYVEDLACVEATDLMQDIMTWPSAGMGDAEEVSPGRFIDIVQSSSGLVALLQYREGEPRVVEIGMLMLSEENVILLLDYHVLRAFHTGAASPEDEDALSLATGEYFCVYM